MINTIRTLTLSLSMISLPLVGVANAGPPAGPAPPPAPAASSGKTGAPPVSPPPKDLPTAQQAAHAETREQLLLELKNANAQLAADKKAAAEAAKGHDKDAHKAAQEKVKADGKLISEINMKLHSLKTAPKTAPPIPPPPT